MKRILLIHIFLSLGFIALAQSKWERREKVITELYQNKEIAIQEWYDRKLKEAGSLGVERKAWHAGGGIINKSIKEYQNHQSKSGLVVHIPDDWKVVMPNGNKYTKFYLFNLTDSSYSIPRVDATVAGFKDYLKIKGRWVKLQTNRDSFVECGNSLFNSKLENNSFYIIHSDSPNQPTGEKKVLYKVSFTLNGEEIESNEITVQLHENQIKRLWQERKK